MKESHIFIICILLLSIGFSGCINQAEPETEIKKERDLLIISFNKPISQIVQRFQQRPNVFPLLHRLI